MPRMDARVKTNLSATVTYAADSTRERREVRFRQLSLGGGVFTGSDVPPETRLTIVLELPKLSRLTLGGIVLRHTPPLSVVAFYYPEKGSLTALWDYLREQPMPQGSCLYCGCTLPLPAARCDTCGLSLRFLDAGYLDDHLQATFSSRALSRLKGLDAEFLRRLITLIDAEVLCQRPETDEEEFVGTAPCILQVFSMIRRAAVTDMNVLILGESGTGKELTAQAIHEKSLRKDGPFIVVNCATIPEGLLEAELFGYEKGAFTGAALTKKGRFELADHGTIFLDEIGDLSHGLQAKLLRFLEDHKLERVGGKCSHKVDIRIVAATNCDLAVMVEAGRFRSDLFFRLNCFTILLPALRERGDDKVLLAQYFFQKFSKIEQSHLTGFSPATLRAIQSHDWPGNVRELINRVRRGLVMAQGEYVEPADMELKNHGDPGVRQGHSGQVNTDVSTELQPAASDARYQQVFHALQQNRFNISHAAKALQVSRPTLYSLIKRYQITMGDTR